MKKKLFVVLSVLVVLVMALSACTPAAAPTAAPAAEEPTAAPAAEQPTEAPAAAPTEAPKAEPVTIRMLVRPDEGGNVAKYAAQFEQETGVKVMVDFVAWSEITNKTLTTLAAGGGGYDIVFMPSADAAKLIAGGWFEPITDAIPEADRAQWLAAVLDFYTVDNNLMAMPWYAGGAHMAYNSEILKTAGVDPESIKTWDDFMGACKAVKEKVADSYCFTPSAKFPGNFYYNWGTMVASRGGEFFAEDGAPVFQEGTAALDAFKMLQTGVTEGYFDKAGVALDDYETLVKFGAGNVAFLLDSTWAATQANRNADLSKVTGKVGYILVPGAGDLRSSSFLYAGGLGVLNTSEHKEEAKKFLAYLTSEEAQKQHAIEGANLPTRVSLYSDADIIAAWPGFEQLAAQLEYGNFVPQVLWLDEWRRSAATAVQEVMNGTKTPEQAVEWLVGETDRIRNQ